MLDWKFKKVFGFSPVRDKEWYVLAGEK